MEFSAQKISEIIDGKVSGNPDVLIHGPAKIEEAESGTITFLGNLKYEDHIYTTGASAVIVESNFTPSKEVSTTLIKVDNVYQALGVLLNHFNKDEFLDLGVSQNSYIHESAEIGAGTRIGHFTSVSMNVNIGEGCQIFDNVFIGSGVTIGPGTIIYPGVRIMRSTKIGSNCILQANAVIGSDGFGFAKGNDGEFSKVQQIGNVVIGNNVEIGANTTIDRATMGSTVIKDGVKLDNLIQIAHNVEIDEHTVIAAQTGVSGSTSIGKYCMIGGQVGFVGHIKVADGTMIQAQSGISRTIKENNTRLYGTPALSYQNYLKSYAYFKKLPEMANEMRQLQKEIALLKNDKC